MHTHGTNFTDRGDGEELLDTKVGGVHSTDKEQRPSKCMPLLCDFGLSLLIMW